MRWTRLIRADRKNLSLLLTQTYWTWKVEDWIKYRWVFFVCFVFRNLQLSSLGELVPMILWAFDYCSWLIWVEPDASVKILGACWYGPAPHGVTEWLFESLYPSWQLKPIWSFSSDLCKQRGVTAHWHLIKVFLLSVSADRVRLLDDWHEVTMKEQIKTLCFWNAPTGVKKKSPAENGRKLSPKTPSGPWL